MESSVLADKTILSHVEKYGTEEGLKRAAKNLHWPLKKIHSRYHELKPSGCIPIALDLNTICGDRWKFADTCRQYEDQGNCPASIASFMKCSLANVQGWIKVSRTFSPELRFPELAPTVYLVLVDLPDPVEAIKFARDEKFTASKAIQLRKKYNRYKRKTGGRPFALVDEDLLVELYEKGHSDAEIAEKLGISRATVLRRREKLSLLPIRKVGGRGKAKMASVKPADIILRPIDAVKELTTRLNKLEAENCALRKQCMTYLGQLKSMNARRFRVS